MKLEKYRVKPGGFRLRDHDAGDTGEFHSKEAAKKHVRAAVEKMGALQEKLYADDRHALLLIFQAMDAAGKDSAIEHVMSGVNPQGCQVYSFKQPSSEELDHDFLWRTNKCLPERGRIGIFNRSYYEEVLVVRVHPEILAKQRLPPSVVGKDIWKQRFEDINGMERYLSRQGTVIRKFFLHVSRKEQRRRFLARLDTPEKNWKFSAADLKERDFWKHYMLAYEEMIAATSTKHAPWYVIPADNKWYTRMLISDIVVDTLRGMKLSFPELPKADKAALDVARKALESE